MAGFNDTEGALMDPPMTSVREFPEELGKHLAEFALGRIQQPGREPQQIVIPTRLVIRKSTRSLATDGEGAGLSACSSNPLTSEDCSVTRESPT